MAFPRPVILWTMSITIQETPNPNARKFILPAQHFAKPLSFADRDAAAAHPLATRLFALGTIYNVFMVQDFVTVNKLPDADWAVVEPAARAIIVEHFEL